MEVVIPGTSKRRSGSRPSTDAVPIQGGTNVMVELNFDRGRPGGAAEPERGARASRLVARDGVVRLASGLTYAEAMESPLASSFRHSPRRRARSARRRSGTGGRSAGTSAPPRPPAMRCRRCSSRAQRSSSGPARRPDDAAARVPRRPKRNAAEPDELITAVQVEPSGAPQTFMKVGPRNAMVIAVCSLAVVADRERGELRASFGSAGPVAGLVDGPLAEASSFPERVAAAASPIDDVRGTAAYRATRCVCSRRGRSRGRWSEDRASQ